VHRRSRLVRGDRADRRHGLLAFRDPYGIRPLCHRAQTEAGTEYMVASESVALEGPARLRARRGAGRGGLHRHSMASCMPASARRAAAHPCIFEYVYLARPDSVMDGISVYQARLNMGETLAKRVRSTVPPNEIDVVIPIPESSRPSAMQLAHLLGIPYREGFVKNRYVGRTFIMPGQACARNPCARSSTPSPASSRAQRAAGR
jgi:amidophosphoribosyltransferase